MRLWSRRLSIFNFWGTRSEDNTASAVATTDHQEEVVPSSRSSSPSCSSPSNGDAASKILSDVSASNQCAGLYDSIKSLNILHHEANIQYTHHHPVEQVVDQYFKKYPSKQFPDVLSADIIAESIDPHTHIHYRRRVFKCVNNAPWILKQFLGADPFEMEEESFFDMKNRVFVTDSRNRSFSSVCLAVENSRFYPHPENHNFTKFEQRGGVVASSWFGPLRGQFEYWAANRAETQGRQMCEKLEEMLNDETSSSDKHSR